MSGPIGVNVKVLESVLVDGATEAQRVMLCAIPGAAFTLFDHDLRFLFADGEAVRAVHAEPQRTVEGRTVREILGPRTLRLQEAYRKAITGQEVELDVVYRGRTHWVHTGPVLDEHGAVVAGLSISIDVTSQRQSEAVMHRRARAQSAIAGLGRLALDGASEGRLLDEGVEAVAATLDVDAATITRIDEASGYLALSAAHGFPQEVVRRARWPISDAHRCAISALSSRPLILADASKHEPDGPMLARAGIASLVGVLIGPKENPYGWLTALTFTPRAFTDEDADFLRSVAHVLWSAIERADAEEEYRHAALHDEVTGLPNRRLFLTRLDRALARAREERGAVAVLLLDLDDFKVINDSLGHDGGDELLRALAPRLQAVTREHGTVARLGGDDFALLCEGIVSEEHAQSLAERLAEALAEPVQAGDRRHAIKGSIGLVIDDGRSSAVSLLRDADTAMHRAKERGGGGVVRFLPTMRMRVVARMRTESELHGALERDELRVRFQPFFSMPDRRLIGMEALVRWQHPDRGLVLPDQFVPLAEQNGQIVELGAWVLDTAAHALSQWRAAIPGGDELTMSVNVSARQLVPLGGDHFLPDTVAAILAATRLPPERFALEVTESMLMDAADEPESVLLELQRLGVQIMLDDFGTGHSSLSRLSDFPLDVVKIDRSFVRGLGRDPGREPIVAAILAMAKALDLRVIAEGVEDEDEWRELAALGCGAAQGFALARPMSADALTALLVAERAA